MAESESELYRRFSHRVAWLILILGLIGAAYLAARRGLQTGASFLIGAAVSYLSFWRWQRLVDAIGPGHKPRSRWSFVIGLIALVALAWVIIKFLRLNIAAAASGLLVSAAAVILEIIYELIYAS